MDYVQIPSYASRIIQAEHAAPASKVETRPPQSEHTSVRPQGKDPPAPKQHFTIPSAILASGIAIPSPSPRNPRKKTGLVSSSEPLSLPTTTNNFRRFALRSGSIFWLQDRIEEIVMWKKSYRITVAWMSTYAFLCYFPRLFLTIPHVILLSTLISAHAHRKPSPSKSMEAPAPAPYVQPVEGSTEWFSNLQAIQNLMGVVSDLHDMLLYMVVPHLTFATPYSFSILAAVTISLAGLLFILPVIPLRPLFLVLGLFPFALTHPLSREWLPILFAPYYKQLRQRVTQLADDDRLEDHHLRSELRTVELWENERFGIGQDGVNSFDKVYLRVNERKGWTRGRDGWSDTSSDGKGDINSDLTFALEPGWAFVETEDWRKDLVASWAGGVESDEDGWVYTNDTWMQPHSHPLEEWSISGVTRRRRWYRRAFRSS